MNKRFALTACLLILSSVAHAEDLTKIVAIQAAKLASLQKQIHPLGSIVQTIVPESEFRTANGPGWVEMKGQSIPEKREVFCSDDSQSLFEITGSYKQS